MTSPYLENTTADSFSGAVFAFEGIKNAVTLINGPTGCKYYHSATSEAQKMRNPEFDTLPHSEKWYFGQPRVPCTYLDTKDYVYGSVAKLQEGIRFLEQNDALELLAIVNSPGAALIGDNLKKIAAEATHKPCIIIESPGFSRSLCGGYAMGANELIKQLELPKCGGVKRDTVNILGLSIFHKYHSGDVLELKRIFELCGVKVNCFLCANCSLESIRDIPQAALNIVIHPEYGAAAARLLEDLYGTPYYLCDGAPIGFKATEKLALDVCGILGLNADRFLVESEKARGRAYGYISRVNSLTGLPQGVKYALQGLYSEIYSYAAFLTGYLGLVLETAAPQDVEADIYRQKLSDLLARLHMAEALDKDILQTGSELVFAHGNTIANLKLKGHRFSGIEISLPTLGYIDVLPKTHLGLTGALMLIEQVLNGLLFR